MDILRRIRRRPSSAKENQPSQRPTETDENADGEIHDEPLSTSTPTKSANGQSFKQKMKVSRKSIDKLMRKMKLKKDGSSSEKVKDDGATNGDVFYDDHDDDDDVVEPKDLRNQTDGASDEGIVKDEPDSPRNEVKIVHIEPEVKVSAKFEQAQQVEQAHFNTIVIITTPVDEEPPPLPSSPPPTSLEVEEPVVELEVSKDAADSNEKDGNYFIEVMGREKQRIESLVEAAERDLTGETVPDDACGCLRAAIGKGRLLVDKKFGQFKSLCDKNLKPQNDQESVLPEDLAGFWDMVSIQVDEIHRIFDDVETLRSSGWQINTQGSSMHGFGSSSDEAEEDDDLYNPISEEMICEQLEGDDIYNPHVEVGGDENDGTRRETDSMLGNTSKSSLAFSAGEPVRKTNSSDPPTPNQGQIQPSSSTKKRTSLPSAIPVPVTRKSSNDSAKKTPVPRKSSIPTLAGSGRKPATPTSSSPNDEERRKKLAEFKSKMRKERESKGGESNEEGNGGEVMSDIVIFNGAGDKQRLRA